MATIDDQTGGSFAVIEANYLNGLRTRAVNALAVGALARDQAATLGVIGIGWQALFEDPCGDTANSTHPGRWTVGGATRLRFLDLGRLANVADQGCLLVPEKALEGWRVLGDRPCDHDDARGLLLHPGVNGRSSLAHFGGSSVPPVIFLQVPCGT